jgi:hypothetical protein
MSEMKIIFSKPVGLNSEKTTLMCYAFFQKKVRYLAGGTMNTTNSL